MVTRRKDLIRNAKQGDTEVLVFFIFLAFIAIQPLFAQTNAAFEAYKKDRQEKLNAMSGEFDAYKKAQQDKFNSFMKRRWQEFSKIPEVSLPESPDALEVKVIDIPAIKEDENPNVEIIDALIKEGVNEERSAQIALEIIDSLGIDAIRKGQSIGIATEHKNEAKPVVVSYNVDNSETVTLLQNKSGGYKYVESDEKTSNKNKQLKTNSKYIFPLKGYYRKTDGFGMRSHPILRRIKKHEGVDYAAPRGNSIYAIADGVVVENSYNNVSGNYIAIKHVDGMLSYYLHLSERGIANGSKIIAGQIIGKVGSTGRSTGPHLHFGIKISGIWQNPEKVLGIM